MPPAKLERHEIPRHEWMPLWAMGFGDVAGGGGIPAHEVFATRDGLQVGWIDAMPHAAAVVYLEAIGDRAHE